MDVGWEPHPRVPCDFEGDIPRIIRCLADVSGAQATFGYDAAVISDYVATISRSGKPTRRGRKSKDLRDCVVAAARTYDVVIAVIDARLDEHEDLRRDVVS